MKNNVILIMYLALAIVLSAVESVFLPASIIPGVKLGLANIVTIVVLYQFGVLHAIVISIFRVLTLSLILGSFFTPSFIISLAGISVSLVIMTLIFKSKLFSCIGVSITASIGHIIGQITAVIIITGTSSIILIAPYLIYVGIITGYIVGFLAKKILTNLKIKMEVRHEF